MKHSLAAAPLALALGAGAFAVTPALAATPTQQATVWSAFSTSSDADKAADNLHFYVQTPVITADEVGQTVTFTPTGSKISFDCMAAIAVVSPTSWTQVGSIQDGNILCQGRVYRAHVTVTPDMVGKRLELNGWAKADDSVRTATVTSSVTIGDQVLTGSDSTRRTASDAKAPVQKLGTWYGQRVGIATSDGGNELVIGSNRQVIPDGEVLHASLTKPVVDVWLADGQQQLTHWTRNLSTGRVDVVSWRTAAIEAGAPGVFIQELDVTGAPTSQRLISWDGVVRRSTGWWGSGAYDAFLGFTDNAAAVVSGGMTKTIATLVPMDGGAPVTLDAHYPLANTTVRPDGMVLHLPTKTTPVTTYPCLFTLAGTCTPLA